MQPVQLLELCDSAPITESGLIIALRATSSLKSFHMCTCVYVDVFMCFCLWMCVCVCVCECVCVCGVCISVWGVRASACARACVPIRAPLLTSNDYQMSGTNVFSECCVSGRVVS